jgi:4-alpha-glucanotransferase
MYLSLKDIAIGVNRNSCDSWIAPNLYRMNKSTGAPPDAFSADGQNWGFPTYNWDEMAKDDYAWWRARLTHMAQYFHAFRIDRIFFVYTIDYIED